jgi:hypothetical protein
MASKIELLRTINDPSAKSKNDSVKFIPGYYKLCIPPYALPEHQVVFQCKYLLTALPIILGKSGHFLLYTLFHALQKRSPSPNPSSVFQIAHGFTKRLFHPQKELVGRLKELFHSPKEIHYSQNDPFQFLNPISYPQITLLLSKRRRFPPPPGKLLNPLVNKTAARRERKMGE